MADKTDLDRFGVHIENEMDELRFAYLLNAVGPGKRWRSMCKYNARYPGSKPFVSTLLRWHRIRVPTSVYAPKQPANYHVYLLVCSDLSRFKIGMSGQWTTRILSFSDRYDLAEYDERLTVAVHFADAPQARRAEKVVKTALAEFSVDAPTHVAFCAGGRHEWRSFNAYPSAIEILGSFESPSPRFFESISFPNPAPTAQ